MQYHQKLEEAINRLIDATVDYKLIVKHHQTIKADGLANIGAIIEKVAEDAINDNPMRQSSKPTIVETDTKPIKAQRQPQRQQAQKPATVYRIGNLKATDAEMLAVLTASYQTPSQIVAKLATTGISISKASAYARMRDLMKDHQIEERDYPAAWRLTNKVAVAQPMKAKAPRKARKAASTKRKANPFAALAKLVESVLTNRPKTVSMITGDVRDHGWNGSLTLIQRVLDSLVTLGVAEENGGRYTRA